MLRTDLRTFRDVIDQYYADKGKYPATLEVLVEDDYLRSHPRRPDDQERRDLGDGVRGAQARRRGARRAEGEEAEPGIMDVHSGSARHRLGRPAVQRMVKPARRRRRARRAPAPRGGLQPGHPRSSPSPCSTSWWRRRIPLWRTAIRRDKEEELIFRGLQYAEGDPRLPAALRPPAGAARGADRGQAALHAAAVGRPHHRQARLGAGARRHAGRRRPQQPARRQARRRRRGPTASRRGASGRATGGSDTPDGNVGLGPIRGVRSRSKDESIKMLFGQNRYDQWQFTVELLQGGGVVNVGGAGVPAPAGLRISAKWIGRPFRPGLHRPAMPGARRREPPQPVEPRRRCGADVPVAVRVRRLPHAAGLPLPAPASAGSAGLDLRAAVDGELRAGARRARCWCPPAWCSRSRPGGRGRCGRAAAWRCATASPCPTRRGPSTATTAARWR